MTMTLKIIDKAYAKKINRLKKQSTKYKQHCKYLVDVAIQQEIQIDKMTENNNQIVQNFEETQTKLKYELLKAQQTTSNNMEFKIIIMIIIWMTMFLGLIRMVHSSNGLSKDDVDIIYGIITMSSIAVFCGYYALDKLLN